MTDRYDLVVYGKPEPGGSKRHIGGGRIIDANPDVKAWRQEVAHEAARIRGGRQPLAGPVELQIVFFLPRPKAHYGTGANGGKLKDTAPDRHTNRPDATKLTRAVEDALRGILFVDDSQVADQKIRKIYSQEPRAIISVASVPPQLADPLKW